MLYPFHGGLIMHARGWTTATVLALLVAGCAQEQRAPSPASPALHRRSAARPQPGPSAADYVARSGSIDLFIIGSSELALQRSANARVREFATMMIQAHKATSAQLSLEGRRLNLLPSATPLPAHQAMLNALQSTPNFDSTLSTDRCGRSTPKRSRFSQTMRLTERAPRCARSRSEFCRSSSVTYAFSNICKPLL